MRLLNQPVFRYSSADPGIIDGAIFVFVEGTDPEAFLQLEALQAEKRAAWRFAFSRMNHAGFTGQYKSAEVWNVPVLPWATATNVREPYCIHTRPPNPGE